MTNLIVSFELISVPIFLRIDNQFEKDGLILVVHLFRDHVVLPFGRILCKEVLHVLPQGGRNPEVVLFPMDFLKVSFYGLSKLTHYEFDEGLSFKNNQFVDY